MEDVADLIVGIARSSAKFAPKSDIYIGEVVSADPLEIMINQTIVLDATQLYLTRNVTEYDIDMTVDHLTELETEHVHVVNYIDKNDGDGATGPGPQVATSNPTEHLHEYVGRKRWTVHNALIEGEKVYLISMLDKGKFIVIDRIQDGAILEDDKLTNGGK